jgi:pyruvate/2-oxoglutarate dehydrogenase complex dihydrolipoamide dehydrogenase (E3) component
MKQKTIAVIGGGSAGLTAARTAHELGANVLFLMGNNADHASLCINAGCMPSKAMFEPIDHEHTVHQLEEAEYYHPTKIEIVSEIGDALCRKLDGHPFARAEE